MKLASIFTDNMVLQAEHPIRIFGEGSGTAEVFFCGEHKKKIFREGSWGITLPAMPYSGPYEMTVILNDEVTVLKNICVGEVWLAAGQSNMEMPLFCIENGFEFAKHAENDNIRLFTVPRRVKKEDRCSGWHFCSNQEMDTPWQLCREETVLNFSAIGYLTARQLQETLNVAVGVISCNYGGSIIESWIPYRELKEHPLLGSITRKWEEDLKDNDDEDYLRRYRDVICKRNRLCDTDPVNYIEKTRQMGIRATVLFPDREEFAQLPVGRYYPWYPGCLYEAMTSRIAPFGMRGIMWYQGEANGGNDQACQNYLEKYLLYMQCMKERFQNPDLRFYAMELASFGYSWVNDTTLCTNRNPQQPSFPYIREQQYKATKVAPNNYVVTTMELGDPNNIHSFHKAQMAHRLAMKILKYSYGYDVPADQPVAVRAQFRDGKAYITVENGEGLFCNYPAAVDIFVADDNKELKKAELQIQGNVLVLSSPQVPQPTLARYAFDRSYLGRHIHNAAGLPLAPFRTDTDE